MTGDLKSLSNLSMSELFRMEVETQAAVLVRRLVALEHDADSAECLRELMRAAHSLKGAARMVGRQTAVQISHAMEDCFVQLQSGKRLISRELTDTLLRAVDVLTSLAAISDESLDAWDRTRQEELKDLLEVLSSPEKISGEGFGEKSSGPLSTAAPEISPEAIPAEAPSEGSMADSSATGAGSASRGISRQRGQNSGGEAPRSSSVAGSLSGTERTLKITAENLDRLMAFSGEALIASRWLDTFAGTMLRLKQLQSTLSQTLQTCAAEIRSSAVSDSASQKLRQTRDQLVACQRMLGERLGELDLFDRRFAGLSQRLYHEVLDCRMQPFADAIQGFPRMVRDVSHSLGKEVRLEITGDSTPVDRDILDRLKTVIDHLLRNAVDHGIEEGERPPHKPTEALIQLEACHSAGMLLITVSDDGRGIDVETIRKAVTERKLTSLEVSQKLTDAELLEFLFLPGFTLKESVSEISGRGVGLDVVQTMVREVGGRVRISSRRGQGTRIQLELPLTLSVVRTLLAEVGGEPYAFPLSRIHRAVKLPQERIESIEGRQHFNLNEEQIGIVAAHRVLALQGNPTPSSEISVIVMGEKNARFGLMVDRFLAERELVVRPLDRRLGKVRNISAAALMPDGSPVLIIDADDLSRSISSLTSAEQLCQLDIGSDAPGKKKQVLVVDDSLTVRELERKLLENAGYGVQVAVDGIDGWNAVRTSHYDLVVTDVDMPGLDGIELLTLIRKDNRLKTLPVMIVSYKDRQQDRDRGLEAGADYYLTKASFHDQTLVRVVTDLIGEAA